MILGGILFSVTGITLGTLPEPDQLPQLPTLQSDTPGTSSSAPTSEARSRVNPSSSLLSGSLAVDLKEAWSTMLEEQLIKRRPLSDTSIGPGLPILPKRLVDKMHSWEYINFNELIRVCDPDTEMEHGSEEPTEQFLLFPGIELIRPGHKLNYSFMQWANCFITYLAAMAQKYPESVTEMCAYFLTILKASKEFTGGMWRFYDASYRQRAAATGKRQWSIVDSALYSQCFTGRARKPFTCTSCGSLKHDTTSCPRTKKGKKPAYEQSPSLRAPRRPAKGPCWDYNDGKCVFEGCTFPHECYRCREEHPFIDCPKRKKSRPNKT